MTLLSAALTLLLAGILAEKPTIIIEAPASPVHLERATILTGAEGPPVLFYAATNRTDAALEQFTVMAFTFAADGRLKAKQVAPGRRTLEARETKYSTMVLDGSPLEATDVVVVGVDQAQRAESEAWWRADLQPAAIAAAQPKKP